MKVEQVFSNEKRSLDLLLLANKQEDMLDCYPECGKMFTLCDRGELRAVCVVINGGEDIYKLKNIATYPKSQRKGYGRYLVEFLFRHYLDGYSATFVRTDGTPRSLSFHQSCGFVPSHRVENFFTDHYGYPICEDGISLRSMIYLRREKL